MAYARQHYNLAVTGKATQNCGDKTAKAASATKSAPSAQTKGTKGGKAPHRSR